jgi:iron complex transport system permease protein
VNPATSRPVRLLRLGERVSLRVRIRSAAVCAVLLTALLAVGLFTLATGDYTIPLPDLVSALFGGGDQATRFVVGSLRAPRLVAGILVGAALGASGAVFQSVTRNPLGSPDVIGFGTGAATGAVAVITLTGGDSAAVAAGALAGGLLTAAAVYLLAFRHGALHGFRLVLVGVGVTGMLTAFNQWMLTRASLNDAVSAQIWLTGSLNAVGWPQTVPPAVALAVLLPPALLLGRGTDLLELVRLAVVGLAVALVAVATATAGPVTFVALAAPQAARRLTRAPGAGIGPAAVTGALIVPVSDLIAQRALPSELPVGVATGAIGGVYLAFLLARQWRGGN